ncbi:hypothetical protein N7540_010957 [Penicillium herquei]|nr:hypothetical protein N7540_010957 [Penicillium herquei]
MTRVHLVMGLSVSVGDNLSTFSSDILRLESHGPHESHLSVIDVPVIFKTTTPDLTSMSEITLVRDMIIEISRELDPDGMRILRILTKPDLVDKGAEDKFIELVKEKQESQELGWMAVRNLGQKDLQDPSKNRDVEEEMFPLRTRLQALLASNVRREFPLVRSEVSKRLKECKRALENLGEERESAEQRSKLLLGIVANFQRITENAFHTNYRSQDAFGEEPDLRLATLVAN